MLCSHCSTILPFFFKESFYIFKTAPKNRNAYWTIILLRPTLCYTTIKEGLWGVWVWNVPKPNRHFPTSPMWLSPQSPQGQGFWFGRTNTTVSPNSSYVGQHTVFCRWWWLLVLSPYSLHWSTAKSLVNSLRLNHAQVVRHRPMKVKEWR